METVKSRKALKHTMRRVSLLKTEQDAHSSLFQKAFVRKTPALLKIVCSVSVFTSVVFDVEI